MELKHRFTASAKYARAVRASPLTEATLLATNDRAGVATVQVPTLDLRMQRRSSFEYRLKEMFSNWKNEHET